ncbi:MAG: phosphate acyltransferase PlsX [Firmicutes bacterium]|nr:phosphate acyltransferase PlsX [Bacillota bacterium]
MTKIVIDGLGADRGPKMVAQGLALAMKKNPNFQAVLVGPKDDFTPLLEEYGDRIEWIGSDQAISNDESPVMAIRRKKDASMVLAFHRLNAEDAQVLLSAGSTGALLAGATFITKRLEGVKRCCLAAILPNVTGRDIILADAGANMDTTPEMLVQFAVLASAYAKSGLGIDRPRIATLSVGAEDHKGDDRVLKTAELLRKTDLLYIGNAEARDLLRLDGEVLICDGFAGNVAVKTAEGTATTLLGLVKEVIMEGVGTKLGGLLLKKSLKAKLSPLDYTRHGGAPLLGARKPVFKAHGNASPETFALAIQEALDYAEAHVEGELEKDLATIMAQIQEPGESGTHE